MICASIIRQNGHCCKKSKAMGKLRTIGSLQGKDTPASMRNDCAT
jgi:hypothetical protein